MIAVLLVVLILVDWLITQLYCYLRKRKYLKNSARLQEDAIREDKNKIPSKVNKLLLYYEGYILYKCNVLQYIPSHRIRKFILRYQFQMNIHPKAMIYHGGEYRHPWKITIESGVSVGDHVRIDGRNGVLIKENVNIGSGVWIWTEQHDYNDAMFECNNKGGMVVINERAWISARAIILPKTTIGEGSVVAAGAVVSKDCDDFKLYGGVPAKVIGERNRELRYNLKGQYIHFY